MSRLFGEDETIQPRLDQLGRPSSFTCASGIHTINHVIQRWEIDTEWWSELGRVNREYFAVTTREGMLCVLYFDHLNEEWHLEKVYD